LLCSILFLFLSFISFAQPCDGVPAPGATVFEAPILCDGLDGLDEYCFTLQTNSCPPIPIPGCGNPLFLLDNPNWFGFVAGDDEISIEIDISNCINSGVGTGAQVVLYEVVGQMPDTIECDVSLLPLQIVNDGGLPECFCQNPSTVNYMNIATNIGSTYYLVFDGCAGDICEIRIRVTAGGEVPGIPTATDIVFPLAGFDPPMVGELDTICAGAENILLTTDALLYATGYAWTLPNGDTVITDDPELIFNFPVDPGATLEFCVQGFNDCSISDLYCESIIIAPLDTVFDTNIFLCEEESTTWMGMTIGPYVGLTEDLVDIISINDVDPTLFNCTTTMSVRVFVSNENTDDPTVVDTVICGTDPFFVFADPYSSSTTNQLITASNVSAAGCDSSVLLTLEFIDINVVLNASDAICQNGQIVLCPGSVSFLPDSNTANFNINYVWTRTSDGQIVGGNDLCLEINATDFNSNTETFELSVEAQLNGKPSQPCAFGPFSVELNASDFDVPAGIISDSIAICLGNSAQFTFTPSIPGVMVSWTNSDPNAMVLQEDDVNYEIIFNQAGIYEICATPQNDCGVGVPVCQMVLISDSIQVGTPNYTCNTSQDSFFYEINFETGEQPFMIITGEGEMVDSIYRSQLIPSGDMVNVIIQDAVGCEIQLDIGPFFCNCITDAGTMPDSLLQICGDGCLQSQSVGDTTFDSNDIFEYILHDDFGINLGNIIARNKTGEFCFSTGVMDFDQTYYISLVVGEPNGLTDSVNLTLPCTRVAPGQPVIWNEIPNATIDLVIDSTCSDSLLLTAMPSIGQGFWSIVGIGASGSFDDETSDTTFVIIDDCGLYTIQWREDNEGCADSTTVDINFLCGPEIFSVRALCNSQNTEIDFEIILEGGQAPYEELNNKGSFTDSLFTITGLALNVLDTFTFIDANGCELYYILETGNCECTTNAGSMSTVTASSCQQNGEIVLNHDQSALEIDLADSLRYYVHTSDADTLGEIVGILSSDTLIFSDGDFVCDSTYYVSAVVGQWDGTAINLGDTCLDVSNGQPIIFRCSPIVFTGLDTTICTNTIVLEGQSDLNAGIWTALTPGATVVTVDFLTATFSFSGPGDYLLQLLSTNGQCFGRDTVVVTVGQSPQIVRASIDTSCSLSGEHYTVSFLINGGDPSTYDIDGGTISGNMFISDSIASGDPFSFIVTDTLGCGADSINGTFSCSCLSSIGQLAEESILLCEIDSVEAASFYNPAGQVIVGNDERNYILVADSSNIRNSQIELNTSGVFLFDENTMNYGQTYFIVLVIGNQASPGIVDLDDVCLLTSEVLQVTWFKKIDFDINALSLEINCQNASIGLSIGTLDDTSGYIVTWTGSMGGAVLPADQNSHTLNVTVPGRYSVTIEHPIAGCDTTAFVDVTQSPDVPFVQIENPMVLTCIDREIQLIGENSSMGNNILYSWIGPGIVGDTTTSNIFVNQAGLYILTVTDTANDCEIAAPVEVLADQSPPIVNAEALGQIRCMTESVVVSGNNSDIGFFIGYEWSVLDSGNIIGSTNTIETSVNEPGVYQLIVTDNENGCQDSAVAIVTYDENFIQDIRLNIKQPNCNGAPDGRIEIAEVIGGLPNYEYSFDGGLTFINENLIDSLSSGIYLIVTRDQNGCEYFDTVQLFSPIEFFVNLGEDQIIPLGDEAIIIAETNLPDSLRSAIQWNPFIDSLTSDLLQQQFTAGLGHYEIALTITDRNGCVERDDINIFVILEERVFIPTAMRIASVNSDNQLINIYADPTMVASLSDFMIFDRWGEKLFDRTDVPVSLTLDPSFAWDGTFKGEPVLPGVYIFVVNVEFVDGSKDVLTGEIHVVE